MPKTSRPKPYDPASAALLAAHQRAAERERARDPATWSIANDTVELPTGEDLDVHRPNHGRRQVYARRLDPFQSLYRAGALSREQHEAAMRLFRDWCISQGVRTDDPRPALEFRDADVRGPSDLVTVRMMDAAARLEGALERVGPATAEVLRALISPLVMSGTVVIWRAEVKRVTGERHDHAQACVVRRACEDLRRAYQAIDRLGAARRQGREVA